MLCSQSHQLLELPDKAHRHLSGLLRPFFDKYDTDSNGKLDQQELWSVFHDLHEQLTVHVSAAANLVLGVQRQVDTGKILRRVLRPNTYPLCTVRCSFFSIFCDALDCLKYELVSAPIVENFANSSISNHMQKRAIWTY